MYFCRVRSTRRLWAKVECFHAAWATLARVARVLTSEADRLGTVPRLESVEGEKQLRSEGFLGSKRAGGLVLVDLVLSREGSSSSFSMEGTRSKKPSINNLISRTMRHSLFRKWRVTARSNNVDVNNAEMT